MQGLDVGDRGKTLPLFADAAAVVMHASSSRAAGAAASLRSAWRDAGECLLGLLRKLPGTLGQGGRSSLASPAPGVAAVVATPRVDPASSCRLRRRPQARG